MENSVTPATNEGGGPVLVSFGSGDTSGQGRLRARANRGRANAVAGPRERQVVERRINGSSISRAQRRRLLDEIQMNARRGRINRGILADINDELNDLVG